MTTTVPLGVLPLLEGVVLAFTSPGTKNLPHATLYKSKVFDEVLYVLVMFLALRRVFIILIWGATKLGNDDALQFLYKVVVASYV
uniref:Uncharacterized protein n=1 Tax=Oryza meridionalis TaxID=40149 RepID=A0A0E0DU48_9ORYZ